MPKPAIDLINTPPSGIEEACSAREDKLNPPQSNPITTPVPGSLAEHLLRMPDVGLDKDFDTRNTPG